MDAAEVIPRDEYRDGRLQVVEFLAETVGQPREPAQVHSDRQVARSICEVEMRSICGSPLID